jgi:non-specific serine/threonine protein kinase
MNLVRGRIHLGRRGLLAGGVPVPIDDRAFEIIQVLAQSAKELVTKDDLMGRLRPSVMVGESGRRGMAALD